MLVGKEYREGPESQWAGVISPDGERVPRLSPFGAVEPWKDPAAEYVGTAAMKRAQAIYPEPPLVLLVSNNEPPDLRWSKHGPLEEISKRYLDRYGKGRDDAFRRRVVAEGWMERYPVMFKAMREAFVSDAWRANVRFVGYGAWPLAPRPLGGLEGLFADHGRVDRARLALLAGRQPFVLHEQLGRQHDTGCFSTQVESMNWVFMLDEAWRVKSQFLVRNFHMDGRDRRLDEGTARNAEGPSANLSSGALAGTAGASTRTCQEVEGDAVPGRRPDLSARARRRLGAIRPLWLLRPRTVREFRGHATPLAPVEALLDGDRQGGRSCLEQRTSRGVLCRGALVANTAHPHPYQVDIPPEYANIPRWYCLDTNLDPPRPWDLTTNLPVFALALVLGDGRGAGGADRADGRRWLVYAHSPLADRSGVEIAIPGSRTITVDVPRRGAFYLVDDHRVVTVWPGQDRPLNGPAQ